MRRVLKFNSGIISGEFVREIIDKFPITEDSFLQRKQYDEYYYNLTEVELTIELINKLTDLGFKVIIDYESIIIE
jgi:hypothetical protein